MVFYDGLLILLWLGGFALAWWLCVSYGVVGIVAGCLVCCFVLVRLLFWLLR